jgi:hypothetical protein
MKLCTALQDAAKRRGWDAPIMIYPSENVSTLREAYDTFRTATIYREIEVGEWSDNELLFEAPDLTDHDEPIRSVRLRLLSEAAVRLMSYGMLGAMWNKRES